MADLAPIVFCPPHGATSSGEPDAQGARPCPLHPQCAIASPPSPQAARQILPKVWAGRPGVGFIGSLLIGTTLAMAKPPGDAPSPRDHGPTLPIEAILAERRPEGAQGALASDQAVHYPVFTAGLREGRVPTAHSPMHGRARNAVLTANLATLLTQPLAIVADSALSQRWLMTQGDALKQLGAVVLVTRVTSLERMQVMRSVRADLPMAAAAVPELARALRAAGATEYPLVILPSGQVVRSLDLVDAPAPGSIGARR